MHDEMHKAIHYNGQWIIFKGQALLDRGTEILAKAATEAIAKQIADALNKTQ